jgi:LAO/AO transport system kinase
MTLQGTIIERAFDDWTAGATRGAGPSALDTEQLDSLLAGLEQGRDGAASRLISILERGDDFEIDRIMETVFPRTGHGWVVGITGPPGVGKSSLLNRLIGKAREAKFTVGAILVDPTSPVSGGAVLGDRIRMSSFARDEDVFLRSMGSRGTLGGLATATMGAVRVLDALKKDIIFVETVGSGQVDVNICDIADTVLLTLMPGTGDAIQSLKAGIREVNDIFVVNKCDRPGAEETMLDIQGILDIRARDPERDFKWEEPIFPTNALTGDGISDLWEGICDHRRRSENSRYRKEKKVALARKETIGIILRKLEKFFRRKIEEGEDVERILNEIAVKSKSPQRACEEIFSHIARTPWTLTQLSEGRDKDKNQGEE